MLEAQLRPPILVIFAGRSVPPYGTPESISEKRSVAVTLFFVSESIHVFENL